MQVVGWLLLGLVVGFNAYATAKVVRHEDDAQRRLLQLLVVWLIPVFGAGAATLAHRAPARRPDPQLDYGASTHD